jgi:lipopolysaccharide/colanic/teichoic acid biosynthesis glycosyltransferase
MPRDASNVVTRPAPHAERALAACKRLIDVVGSTVTLLVALPLLAVVALLVLILDGRPVLFRQERVGRGGRPFTMLKFRTMVGGAERMLGALQTRNERHGPLFKLTDDPRVTTLGRFLRNSSLDELPQLFNVLRGDMSLVGPRPALASETAQFNAALREARQQVRPGITGLWQIKARDDPAFDEYERLDILYVEARTLRLDLAILALTLPAVLRSAVRRMGGRPAAAPRPDVAVAPAPWQSTPWYGRRLRQTQPSLLRARTDGHD